jgi:alcohol dehydrogenase class IV
LDEEVIVDTNFDANVQFTLPTKVFYGYNTVNLVAAEAKKLGIKKALVVTDRGINAAGVIQSLLQNLQTSGLPFEIFDEVPIDPDTQVVGRGAALLKEKGCNGVVIIGGGSPLCAGKGIALVATNGGNVREYEGLERYKTPPLPVVALPTTAGSGSEVSTAFLITDEQRSQKMASAGYHIYPEVAILDPLLLRTLPARQFAMSGIDALTHAIEATCTSQATPLTDGIAYNSIRIIMKNLAMATYTDNLNAKGNQLFASTMANIACGNAKLGLVHGLSESPESYHLAHGLSVGILLPYIMEYNLPACEEKLARMAEVIETAKPGMALSDKARASVEAVKELLVKLDFADRIPQDVVPKSEILKMVKAAMGRPQVKAFNARKPTEAEVIKILEAAYDGWR